MSTAQSNESSSSGVVPASGDVVEVKASSIGRLAYTTTLIFGRTAALVGGPILPQHPPQIEVDSRADGRLAIVVHTELYDRLRNLLDGTPLWRSMQDLYHRCYTELYNGSTHTPPISARHELRLAPEQSAQLCQALLLLLLNYSNRQL